MKNLSIRRFSHHSMRSELTRSPCKEINSEIPLRARGPVKVAFRPEAHSPLKYDGPVNVQSAQGGVVHEMPADLGEALLANATALDAWNDITPLARNEFICWVEDAKQETTRARRIRRTQEELEQGQRRPCCWPGCKHRERTGR